MLDAVLRTANVAFVRDPNFSDVVVPPPSDLTHQGVAPVVPKPAIDPTYRITCWLKLRVCPGCRRTNAHEPRFPPYVHTYTRHGRTRCREVSPEWSVA